MRVVQITDGDHTWRGPYILINTIAEKNIKLAEKFSKKLIESFGKRNYSNQVITSILSAKAKNGVEIEDIEKEMSRFRLDYYYDGKPMADYYEQKFLVYIEIAVSFLYTEEERKEAYEKAYNQVEVMQNQKIDYYFIYDEFIEPKLRFKNLCEKYNKQYNIAEDKNDEDNSNKKYKKTISEEQFIKSIKKCKSMDRLESMYKDLLDYNKQIILKNYETWEILLNKTFEINKNLSLFYDYLKESNFPQVDFFKHHNSKYLYIPFAISIKNINTRQEALNYLFDNSGHSGFIDIIKTYEVVGNKDMCLTLFERYLHFCKLLTY